jgi:galactosyl transferase GMA12/MNN10 family
MLASNDSEYNVELYRSCQDHIQKSLRGYFSFLRRIVLLLFSKLIRKDWLSRHHWIVDGTTLFIAVGVSVLFFGIFIHIFATRIIWTYQHLQCFTRESAIRWTEGPSHTMDRQCPSITQYQTLLQQQRKHSLNAVYDPSNICITTLSDSAVPRAKGLRCRNFDNVSSRTWPNHLQYAQKHGYVAVDQSVLLDPSRPPAWSKIRAVQDMFSAKKYSCEWVLWLDADTVIMNSSIPLESILPHVNENVDLVVTADRRFTANSGVWLIRNSLWSHQFLNDWWNLKSFVRPSGLSLSGDNDAFGYLVRKNEPSLGTELSHLQLNKKLADVSSNAISPIRMIPRCQMNSFGVFVPTTTSIQPIVDVSKEDWYIQSNQWYYAGDFIAHASGIDQKDVGVELLLARAT